MSNQELFDVDTPEGMAKSKQWLRWVLDHVRQGGTWAIPRSGSVYRIDHEAEIAYKTSGEDEPSITKVFNEIGWTVINESYPPYSQREF